MNPTLISGFEDIMTHIKNQGERIKALQANEKVREERTQELYLENQQLKAACDFVCNEAFDEVVEQVGELQEENKKLNAHLAKYKEAESYLQPFENPDGFAQKIKTLLSDNKEYEAESLCSQIKEKRLYEEVFGLRKQVKELEAKVQEGVKVCEGAKESMEEMFAKIKELEAKCATKDYKLTNGLVIQATQSEIDICEIYEKKLDAQFEEMDEEIKYHFRDSP